MPELNAQYLHRRALDSLPDLDGDVRYTNDHQRDFGIADICQHFFSYRDFVQPDFGYCDFFVRDIVESDHR